MAKQSPTAERQAEIRATGLLAAPGERWTHEHGALDLLPLDPQAKRRQRRNRRIDDQNHQTTNQRNDT